jgi:hypothetical protein
MTPMPTTSTPVPVHAYTAIAQRHKDGSVLLSIADDRICKLNGIGSLSWMILEQSPACLTLGKVVKRNLHTEILRVSEKEFCLREELLRACLTAHTGSTEQLGWPCDFAVANASQHVQPKMSLLVGHGVIWTACKELVFGPDRL